MRKVRIGTAPLLTCGRQLDRLISDINRTSSCKAEGCNGELIFILRVWEVMGKHIFIVLEGVELEIYAFLVRAPTRSPNKAFALQVAFICSGASYAQYEAVLG